MSKRRIPVSLFSCFTLYLRYSRTFKFAINRSLQTIKFRGSLRDRLSANVTSAKILRMTSPLSKVSKANEYSLVSERIALAAVNRRASVYFRSRFTSDEHVCHPWFFVRRVGGGLRRWISGVDGGDRSTPLPR